MLNPDLVIVALNRMKADNALLVQLCCFGCEKPKCGGIRAMHMEASLSEGILSL